MFKKVKRLANTLSKRIRNDFYRYEIFICETNSNKIRLVLFPLPEATEDDITGIYNYVLGYCDAKELSFEDLSAGNKICFEF